MEPLEFYPAEIFEKVSFDPYHVFGSLDFQLGNPNKFLGDKNMPISTV